MNWFEENNKLEMPPASADWFLEWFCKENYLEEVKGDLHELFRRRTSNYSSVLKFFYYWLQVLKFFRPYIIKKTIFGIDMGSLIMFKSYLKISIRNLYKNAFYSIINIAGLAVGMACVLFIVFFVKDELSYDQFNEKADQIYRITIDGRFKGNDFISPQTGAPVAIGYKNEFPEVLDYVRIRDRGLYFIELGDKVYKEPHVHFADSSFFDIFSVKLLQGDPENVLHSPYQIAISKEMALKYFGTKNPVGEILRLDNKDDFTVTGVFEDFPTNSHFHANFIASMSTDKQSERDAWTNANYYTYLLLQKGISAGVLVSKYDVILKKYLAPEVAQFGISVEEFIKLGNKWEFKFQKLSDIHLYSNLPSEMEPNGSIEYVYIFGAIGLFILLLASVNFINLSTARSSSRAKEVGIKKVVGSFRKDLILQFLTESVTLTLISLIIAVGLVELLLPYFNNLADKNIVTNYLGDITLTTGLLLVTILTGLLAGSFPAFVFSAFRPVEVIKGNLSSGIKKGWLRSGLVIFQFTISIIILIGTMVVYNQLTYIQNRELGFGKEQRLIIEDAYILDKNINAFKEEVRKISSVRNLSVTGYLPIDSYRGKNGSFPDGDNNSSYLLPIESWRVDCDYAATMGLEIVAGRDFSPIMPTDSSSVIINEACVKHFEWENPLEHQISRYGAIEPVRIDNYNVVGVVKNFHFESLKNEIQPLILYLSRSSGYITVSFRTEDAGILTKEIEAIWSEFVPGQPFSFRFMDESFDKMYSAEQKIGNIFTVFALIAIFVGCLGLFALSAYTAERKTKEIGIRRVLGASVQGVTYMLSREFVNLVIISFLIAAPIAYILMSNWLNNYAYRTELKIETLLLAAFISICIAVITVSYHAIKASLIKPAKSLKCE